MRNGYTAPREAIEQHSHIKLNQAVRTVPRTGVIAYRKRSDGADEVHALRHSDQIALTYEFYACTGVLLIGVGNGKNYEKRKGEKRESLIF